MYETDDLHEYIEIYVDALLIAATDPERVIKASKASKIKLICNGLGLSGVAGSCSIPSLAALGSIPCQCLVYWRVQYRVG
jgi:hypothetical protein